MKIIGVVLMTALAASVAQAGETVLGNRHENGGFGAPVVRYAQANGRWGFMGGIRGGWIIDHVFSVGGAYYGFGGTTIKTDILTPTGNRYLYGLSYGGPELELIISPEQKTSYSITALFGLGSVALHDPDANSNLDSSSFFVFEPGFHVIANMTNFLRLDAGLVWRLVTGVGSARISNGDVSGPAISLSAAVGVF